MTQAAPPPDKPLAAGTPITVDFAALPVDQLFVMKEAGERILECYRSLANAQTSIVDEVLRGQGAFVDWDHYPAGDVYDRDSHAQYYFHAHPPENRANVWGAEKGHFHTFLRPKGMPPKTKPARLPDYKRPRDLNNMVTHFVAISMNSDGFPARLFTTNRWVTSEIWYPADTVISLLDRFSINGKLPSAPVNTWITNMMRLFRPQIEELLKRRDAAVEHWQETYPKDGHTAYEDRDLEVTSITDIDVEHQVRAVETALAAKRA